MGLTKEKAIKLGIIKNLGKYTKRETTPWTKEKHSEFMKEWHKTHKHPRGMLGKKHPNPQFKKGHNPWNTGTKGLMKIWNKNKKCPKELYPNFGMRNKKHLEKSKKNMSKAHTGKKLSEEHKRNIGLAEQGEKNWNWLGGKSFEPYGLEFNKELKEKIRKRDNYECQECHKKQEESKGKLSVHHIDYNKKNNSPTNLISLCQKCHVKTNHNRKHWEKHFKMKMFIKELFNPENILIFNDKKQLIGVNKIKNG